MKINSSNQTEKKELANYFEKIHFHLSFIVCIHFRMMNNIKFIFYQSIGISEKYWLFFSLSILTVSGFFTIASRY